MTISTKFSIGDRVWVMLGNKPTTILIYDIKVLFHAYPCNNYGTEILKSVSYKGYGKDKWIEEAKCYASKEELLASL